MNQSEDIKELVSALSKAQSVMVPAKFNRVNPHFKNRYADFTSCMDCCRKPLADNGLSTIQYCETQNDKLFLVTMLAHVSGQWMKSYFPLTPKNMDSQSIGSAMTYAKRYSLSAMLGIVSDDEDDDAEASHGRYHQPVQQKSQTPVDLKKEPPKLPYSKIADHQVLNLKLFEKKLDLECREKIFAWMKKTYNVTQFEDLSIDAYQKVVLAVENAVKFVDQQKKELVHA